MYPSIATIEAEARARAIQGPSPFASHQPRTFAQAQPVMYPAIADLDDGGSSYQDRFTHGPNGTQGDHQVSVSNQSPNVAMVGGYGVSVPDGCYTESGPGANRSLGGTSSVQMSYR